MAGDVEVRGFALMLAVRVAYLAFLLWLFIPEAYLQELGITYYPSNRNLADARCKSAERVGLRGYTQPTTHAVPPLCHIPPDIPQRQPQPQPPQKHPYPPRAAPALAANARIRMKRLAVCAAC
eukprot:XP_001700182.1 predicted protein [Chlamydomonas reinhardtii]